MKSLVVIPTYNERENLGPLLSKLLSQAKDVEVLVIDDNSPDGTGQLAEDLAIREPRIKVLHRGHKEGLGSAYVLGFQYALDSDYEIVVQMDADFSHRPDDLHRLLACSRPGGVVIGSRYVRGGRIQGGLWFRRILSRGGNVYTRLLLGLPLKDCTGGFKCFRRSALQALDLQSIRSNGYAFQIEVNYKCHRSGIPMSEVPIVFMNRAAGKSKMSTRIVLEAMLLVLRFGMTSAPTGGEAMDAVR